MESKGRPDPWIIETGSIDTGANRYILERMMVWRSAGEKDIYKDRM